MSSLEVGKQVLRKSFGKLSDKVPVPNLIEVQSKSFNDFAQLDYLPGERADIGLEKVLKDIFPIEYEDKMSLEYVSYELGDWACTCGKLTGIENRWLIDKKTGKYKSCSDCLARVTLKTPMSLDECRVSGQSFSLPLKIRIQLINWDVDSDGKKLIKDIKEQDIFFTDLPIMGDLYEENGRIKVGSLAIFLINGVDRVVVSQMHRSPGVVFSRTKKVKDLQGGTYYKARIIPMRGSWLDLEFDSNDCLYIRMDKKKKILASAFLQALGVPKDEIVSLFYKSDKIYLSKNRFARKVDDSLVGQRLESDMLPDDAKSEFIGKRLTKESIKKLIKSGISELSIKKSYLTNKVFARDVINPETGEIVADQGQTMSADLYDSLKKVKGVKFEIISSSGYAYQPTMGVTLSHDSCNSQEDALKEVHSKIWPGDSSSVKDVLVRLENSFFSRKLYDLTKVGRIRMNRKLGLSISGDEMALTREDIISTIQYLINLREKGEGELDDIDHLGNRRVRLVGELLSSLLYVGFARIERIVKERFRVQEAHGALMPQDLLNVKPLSAVVREFFGTGQLSQFMDQTNPLSEIAHKRRLSALGPGGVLKDRATNEIRDVHTSHYGRICPIETPEGQTIGLISSLATYALVNDLGFIETAYKPVKDGKIKDEVVFMDAFEEADHYIAQADAQTEKSKLKKGAVLARKDGNFLYTESSDVDYIDLSPKQLVSVAAALIPFLEHDDATRALMGANMQRQAVPLINPQAPIVGTGMEAEVCKASGAAVLAKRGGKIVYVSSSKIIVKSDEDSFASTEDWLASGVDIYDLRKFQLSSYNTWIHQRPIVKAGQTVYKGETLTDGPAINDSQLALGTNLTVAFMPWHGYNFEDAILLSKRLVSDDVLTSVYLDEYVVDARDTKLGPEEITRDIPNLNENVLAGLDEDGIVKIGTRVAPGDILVGKVTLKGDVQYSPEEKLLRAIFGEKSREVRDTSLRVPPGVQGTIVDVKVLSRGGIRKDKRYKDMVLAAAEKIENEFVKHISVLQEMVSEKITKVVSDKEAGASVPASLVTRKKIDKSKLKVATFKQLLSIKTKDTKVNSEVTNLKTNYEVQERILAGIKEEKIARLKKGDPLPSGVIKVVKVYVGSKRPVSVGDKLAVRHGNKGVVSNIVPQADMPYLDDGTPVDIVLNPVGVVSRMNVGQILETVLGFAGKKLGKKLAEVIESKSYEHVKAFLSKHYGKDDIDRREKLHGKKALGLLAEKIAKTGVAFETPVFDGASLENDIEPLLKELDMPESGSYRLRDGRTGEYFDQETTVGTIYTMKLNHMVEDKMHARSVGPYSLVTQQPLGGKAQFGGQRFGEMEVWALEAYGAAYTLQELLTYKSDDVNGRHKVYETIVRGDGDNIPDPGLPESFNVMVKELQSLGLSVDLFKSSKEEVSD
jgi:DNA-directed RNA polymerase subunit beta